MSDVGIATRPEELTPEYVTAALRAGGVDAVVGSLEATTVGTGQMALSVRLALDYVQGVGPWSVVAKIPADGEMSRAAGASGGYRNEVRFYTDLAESLAITVPKCYFGAVSDDLATFTLLLEDLAPGAQGDQIAGCSIEQARLAVEDLAGLHGPRWKDRSLFAIDWLSHPTDETGAFVEALLAEDVPGFIDRYGDRLAEGDAEVLHTFAEVAAAWMVARMERFTLVHADYRLDNLLFRTAEGGYPVVCVDWQTVTVGAAGRDLAYFLGNGLPIEDRRREERTLVAAYLAALRGHGVYDYDIDTCFDDYRLGHLQGPFTTVLGAMHVERTDRGDDMFVAMATRCCAAIRDLSSFDLL